MINGDISDILNAKDQLMAGTPIPNTGGLTDDQRRQVMKGFMAYIGKNRITLDQVVRQLGSPKKTTILNLRDGICRKNADEHVRKLNLWIEQHARRQAASLDDAFVATARVARAMLSAARLTYENQVMGIVFGPSGIGKSRCAMAIHETHVGSVYVRIVDESSTPRGLKRALTVSLNLVKRASRVRDGKAATPFESVVATLQGSGRLLLIDEAQKLNEDALELLRDLHDCAGVPIMVISTRDLYERIVRDADADHGQLYSRFDIVNNLTQGRDMTSGGEPLIPMSEIKQMYNRPPIRLTSDAERYLFMVANQLGYGSHRRCKSLLRNAARRARKRAKVEEHAPVTVSADDLDWVERTLRQDAGEQELATERRKKLAAGGELAGV